MAVMTRWALIGGLYTCAIVASVRQENPTIVDAGHEPELHEVERDSKNDTLAEILQPEGATGVSDSQPLGSSGCNGSSCTTVSDFVKPLCEEGRGCNYSLNCFNFSTLGNESFIPRDHPPSAIKISPVELDSILDNKTYANCCVVVMFFAPWCEFSAQFGRKFNAVGRAFDGLPVLAVDLDEPEPHKYILAYTPVVALYYRGRIVHRFKTSYSYEAFRDTIANMTEFTPNYNVQVDDPENEFPVPTTRQSEHESLYLYLAIWWVVFVLLVYTLNSRPARSCLQYLCTLRQREKVD